MKPAYRSGLVTAALVALATVIVWAAAGPRWALAVLSIGAGAIVAFHLYNVQRLTDWAAGPSDAPVPEGRGTWAPTFSAIHRRVRSRLAYQRDLKLMIERFRRAADAMPDGVVVLDAGGRIEWANPRAIEQLGLNVATDRGQAIVNLMRQPDFLRYLESGDWGEGVVVESHRGSGRTLALQLVPFGVSDKLLMSRDVTHIEAAARMRRDFIANVSHELKTPLTVIAGFVETMQDLDLDERQRKRYLALMQEQATNMRRLVSDLLTLSALESEHEPSADDHFAAIPLLLEVSAEAKALSGDRHAISLDIRDPATLVGSRDELASAFGNLVSNAIRYTPSGGSIALSWRVEPDGTGVFAVTDTGIGIAPEHIPRLTERFYRIDRSRSRATGGTGLGLAIVKHVLLRHQAELGVASTPGAGSTFSVRLPARRVDKDAGPLPETAHADDETSATSSAGPRETGS